MRIVSQGGRLHSAAGGRGLRADRADQGTSGWRREQTMGVTRTTQKSKKPAAKVPSKGPATAKTAKPQAAVKYPSVAVPRTNLEDWPPQAELVLSAIEAGQHRMG